MVADNDSILNAARSLSEARFALDSALSALVAQLPEDAQAEFGESDVAGFALSFGPSFDRNTLATQGLRRFSGGGVAFFDTNGSCGAAQQGISEFGEAPA